MGGEGQPQSQAAVFTRHVLFGQPLDKALDAPRWLLGRTWGSTHTDLRMEPRFDENLIDRLMAAGHDVRVFAPFDRDVRRAALRDRLCTQGRVGVRPCGANLVPAQPQRRRDRQFRRRRGARHRRR